jgi:hypothetical protein
MREFGESDKKKKSGRISMPENPANLSGEQLSRLADAVNSSLKEGYLPCGAAFKIARDEGVPRIAVGAMTDKLGVRVSNCQIGCFKVDKILHRAEANKSVDDIVLTRLEGLKAEDALTCVNVHGLARELKMTPMAVADVANARDMKVRQCQLGCF